MASLFVSCLIYFGSNYIPNIYKTHFSIVLRNTCIISCTNIHTKLRVLLLWLNHLSSKEINILESCSETAHINTFLKHSGQILLWVRHVSAVKIKENAFIINQKGFFFRALLQPFQHFTIPIKK